jgi:hypothetical protein
VYSVLEKKICARQDDAFGHYCHFRFRLHLEETLLHIKHHNVRCDMSISTTLRSSLDPESNLFTLILSDAQSCSSKIFSSICVSLCWYLHCYIITNIHNQLPRSTGIVTRRTSAAHNFCILLLLWSILLHDDHLPPISYFVVTTKGGSRPYNLT